MCRDLVATTSTSITRSGKRSERVENATVLYGYNCQVPGDQVDGYIYATRAWRAAQGIERCGGGVSVGEP